MAPEGPVDHDEQGRPLFSYRELVRRNLVKGEWLDPERHAGLGQGCLEQYLVEHEFAARFGMAKADFAKVPRWKQAEMKRALQLF